MVQPTMESSPLTDNSPKTFVILGSKRGGTSFLTQVLGNNCVQIDICGNGHNEDLQFVNFNDMILKEAGGDWNNLPPDEKIKEAIDKHTPALVELIRTKAEGKKMWGWKDPRQGATIKHFLPHLDGDVYLVCIFRQPQRVAESINRVWGKPIEKGKEIAMSYYERILDAAREFISG